MNIPGVTCYDSGIPGKSIGVIACTHGGEVVGLKIISELAKKIEKNPSYIKKGKLFLIVANIKGYEKYYKLEKKLKNKEKLILETRYIDENLNRCCSIEKLKRPIGYERKRANELSKVLSKLDVVFDIHSTVRPSGSVLLLENKDYSELKSVFDVDLIYTDLIDKAIGKPLIDICVRAGGVGIGIEAGGGYDKDSYVKGKTNLYLLLNHYNTIKTRVRKMNLKNKNIRVYGSILVTNKDFREAKKLKDGDIMQAGSIIAYEGEKEISVKKNSIIIMPALHRPGEEYCFLGEIGPRSSVG